ncbi:unnamed protein product [Coffea canephora]|uniref:G-patch domain-containing protein n=1 Tax=Coffea canephora TaxID=49390 RepID=A0A068V8S7_COFCA|nr:unnamed protein product [Coffea canephora]
MAGINEFQQEEGEENSTSSKFEWDENSQLYYHSSTGFYFNPQEGWYYSSRDGLYYKFEDGNYVLLNSDLNPVEQCKASNNYERTDSDKFDVDNQCMPVDGHKDGEGLAERLGTVSDECTTDDFQCVNNHLEGPPPPSEWLEDTLIDLYLSGYPNQAASTASDITMDSMTNDIDALDMTASGQNDAYELEEGEWIPDDLGSIDLSRNITDEGASWEEDNWQAQYGQVTEPYEELALDIQMVDLWDWKMIRETRTSKGGKHSIAKLVGRLVKSSSKLHPSVPSGGIRLKTAPIREAHRDLIRVTSGQIYRLKRPSSQYLASVLTYDSSNPTRDWGFPPLSLNSEIQQLPRIVGPGAFEEASSPSEHPHVLKKAKQQYAYRDRAAERRTLHGGFGVGPGQKKAPNDADSAPSSPTSACPEEAAAESLNISFGAGSYARRLLENMGWKEGETLGKSTKGLVEPLQAIGNKGNAGLGWDDSRKKFLYSGSG